MSANKIQEVEVKGVVPLADASPSLCFAFANLSFLFWAAMMGFFGPNTALLLGCCQLGVYGCYHISSSMLIKRGAAWDGNVFMIFASMFAGCGGLLNVTTGICGYLGVPIATQLPGILWLSSGIILMLLCPGVRRGPAAGFLFYVAGGIGLILQGLCTLGLIPMGPLYIVSAWCFFVAGVLGIWVVTGTMYSYIGTHISLGRPLFKEKAQAASARARDKVAEEQGAY